MKKLKPKNHRKGGTCKTSIFGFPVAELLVIRWLEYFLSAGGRSARGGNIALPYQLTTINQQLSRKTDRFCKRLKGLFLLFLWSAAPFLAPAGIPEPHCILYGVVSNVTDQTRVTSGTLTWSIRSPQGSPIVLQTALTNLNDQYSYRLEIPCESALGTLQVSSNALPLSAEATPFDRSDVQEGQTDAGIVVPSLPEMVLAQRDRGRMERVDLEVIRWPTLHEIVQGELEGPKLILERDQGSYHYRIRFSNGQSFDVTHMSDWEVLEVLPLGSDLTDSTLQVGPLSNNVAVTLQSSYEYEGTMQSNHLALVLMSSDILPVLDILTASADVPYTTLAMDLFGTNNALVVGTLVWSNSLTGAGSLPASEEWSISSLPLEVGHNQIRVQASNDLGYVVHDQLTLYRAVRIEDEPPWWYQWGVMDSSLLSPQDTDYSLANQGQLKWMISRAYAHLDDILEEGAGSELSALLATLSTEQSYLAFNQGQLKRMTKPFYDRLWELGKTNGAPEGVTTRYPWESGTNAPSDYAAVNVGQLKYIFSFEVK